ncbi:MAG: neutral zinc metallopeptidase [Sandaracinus sp.]|nr:neutral zinc metallopeptidase [Sandaracinus sp.]MCB9620141.1 neutral zinc metallopeptidase [Sandaracinus sp.]
MRWQDGRRSSNVEDRRGGGGRRAGVALGGGGALVLLVVAIVMSLLGEDPSALLDAATSSSGPAAAEVGAELAQSPEEARAADFVAVVLADTEDTWGRYFTEHGSGTYPAPTLVLFRESVESACGFQSSAVGPFYCPADRKVYLDLAFFGELERLGAPGDFAQAYVIGHEIGHHLQTVLGVSQRLAQQKRGLPEAQRNALSVRQELQADCFAGVWAHHAHAQRQILETGDVEEGLAAAASIGDDTLQRRAGGRLTPESWTHGSSAQRVRWFRVGLQSGDLAACDTYSPATL